MASTPRTGPLRGSRCRTGWFRSFNFPDCLCHYALYVLDPRRFREGSNVIFVNAIGPRLGGIARPNQWRAPGWTGNLHSYTPVRSTFSFSFSVIIPGELKNLGEWCSLKVVPCGRRQRNGSSMGQGDNALLRQDRFILIPKHSTYSRVKTYTLIYKSLTSLLFFFGSNERTWMFGPSGSSSCASSLLNWFSDLCVGNIRYRWTAYDYKSRLALVCQSSNQWVRPSLNSRCLYLKEARVQGG